jgi:hypothetical protein
VKCCNCDETLWRSTDVFGSNEHPVCILCWLDPAPPAPTGNDKDVIWTPSDVEVIVPYKVATCCFCDSPITVEVYEWETETRKPTEGGMWIRHSCDLTCRGSDNMDDGERARIEGWVVANIRILRDVPSGSAMIPGIRCPALEMRRKMAKCRGGAL